MIVEHRVTAFRVDYSNVFPIDGGPSAVREISSSFELQRSQFLLLFNNNNNNNINLRPLMSSIVDVPHR